VQCTFNGGLRTIFRITGGFWNKLLEERSAIGKPEKLPEESLEGFSQLVISWEQSELYFGFVSQKTAKKHENHELSYKSTVLIISTFNKYSSHDMTLSL
jgi:hypothetical protein